MLEKPNVSGRVRGGASRATGAGQVAFDRLTQSVEAAQAALKDLRNELSKGTRDTLRDLDTTLRHARKNLRSMSETVTADLEKIQQALTASKPPKARAAHPPKRDAKATTARKPTAAAKATKEEAEPTAESSEQQPLANGSAEKEPGSATEQ